MAAPVVWAILFLIDRPQFDMLWLLLAPLSFLMLALVRPVVEEIVFRGLIQGWCINRGWGGKSVAGITLANISTSILFTALHLLSHTPLMALLVLVPSLLFGYFRDRYAGWLLPSIALHCFYNSGYFLLYQPDF
ncbi:MAG: JDVT-CTERM system glutamic-type intramembrane protease [Mariprofundus sp.]